MKNIKKIGKMMLKSIIFIAGFIAFICLIGEPVDSHYAWVENTFGSLAWACLIIEKFMCGVSIYVLVRIYELIQPDAFKCNREVSTETSED